MLTGTHTWCCSKRARNKLWESLAQGRQCLQVGHPLVITSSAHRSTHLLALRSWSQQPLLQKPATDGTPLSHCPDRWEVPISFSWPQKIRLPSKLCSPGRIQHGRYLHHHYGNCGPSLVESVKLSSCRCQLWGVNLWPWGVSELRWTLWWETKMENSPLCNL